MKSKLQQLKRLNVLPENQQWLIERMRQLKYPADSNGVCNGVGYMGMQAALAKDLATFDQRLFVIHSIPENDFARVIEKERVINTSRHLKDKKEKAFREQELLSDTNIKLSIPAFFEGIEIYHQPYLYPGLFPEGEQPHTQNAQASIPLGMSKELEKQNGIAEVSHFYGAYSKKDLHDYFQSIKEILTHAHLKDERISFVLKNIGHTVNINYDPETKKWLCVNALRLPTQEVDEKDIAQWVNNALSKNENTVFSTEIYCTQSHSIKINKIIQSWQDSEQWKKIHTISEDRAQLVDSRNATLLYLAAQMGDVTMINDLLSHGANPNQLTHNQSLSPIRAAIAAGQLQALTALVDGGAILPGETQPGPLITAINEGQNHIVDFLLKQKQINVNESLENGLTAISLAVQKGNLAIVKLLLAADADLDLDLSRASDGAAPIIFALDPNKLDILKALLQKDPNQVNHNMKNGLSPLIISISKNLPDVFDELLQHKADVNNIQHSYTPLVMASMKIDNEEDSFSFVQKLLKAGADPNVSSNKDNLTPLMCAVMRDYPMVANELLNNPNHRADPNTMDSEGETPLTQAIKLGRNQIAMILMKNANINLPNKEGYTPLLLATLRNKELVIPLMSFGANIDQSCQISSRSLRNHLVDVDPQKLEKFIESKAPKSKSWIYSVKGTFFTKPTDFTMTITPVELSNLLEDQQQVKFTRKN